VAPAAGKAFAGIVGRVAEIGVSGNASPDFRDVPPESRDVFPEFRDVARKVVGGVPESAAPESEDGAAPELGNPARVSARGVFEDVFLDSRDVFPNFRDVFPEFRDVPPESRDAARKVVVPSERRKLRSFQPTLRRNGFFVFFSSASYLVLTTDE
jgi:hypothetical protein